LAKLPWGNASGSEFADKEFEFGFSPNSKTRVIFHGQEDGAKSTAERLFDATAGAKIWASGVAMRLDRSTRDRLFRQLDNLHDEEEWFDGDNPVSLESFKSFVRAIIAGAIGGKPGLSLTPAGNLIALWHGDRTKLTVEFQPSNVARFLWSQEFDGETERVAGATTINRLSEFLAPLEDKRSLFGS
jgi:hypothetical protein